MHMSSLRIICSRPNSQRRVSLAIFLTSATSDLRGVQLWLWERGKRTYWEQVVRGCTMLIHATGLGLVGYQSLLFERFLQFCDGSRYFRLFLGACTH